MTKEEFQDKHMTRLNPQQQDAVLSVKGPSLLLAVPGSGKTMVLVTRLGYMVHCCDIPPENILTMTYTVAATKEMRQRFGTLFGEENARRMEFRTINGISSKIIDYYSRNYGRGPAFSLIESESEKAKILGQIYRQFNKEFPPLGVIKDIQTAITYIKNMMLSSEDIEKLSTDVKEMPAIYQQYVETLKNRRQMDYDDQMDYALQILRRFPDVLDYFQNRFQYICVDESQDTSKIQHAIIKLLAQKSGNIFMVGDEDQSIYGFRAAYPDALMNFEKDYPNAKVLLMEENYRSTPEITAIADSFVSKNRFRHKKTIKATRDSGPPVMIIHAVDRLAQFKFLFEKARTGKHSMAVLYRNNDSALPLIDIFERSGISYNVRKFEETFFSNRVVTDVVDIMKFAYDLTNEDVFMRIYYKFGSPISKKAALFACEKSKASGKPIFEELLSSPEIKGYVRDTVIDLVSMFPQVRQDSAETALHRIWHGMRYRAYAEEKKLDAGKFEILSLLARNESSAKDFLRRLRELKEILQNHQNGEKAQVLLSSIHSSKGLEYDRVFLLDVFDRTLPSITVSSADSMEEIRQYEEERRLFYVAMTRAKNELYLFKCEKNPSSFLDEVISYLPKELIDERDVFAFLKRNLCGKTYADATKGTGVIIAHCNEQVLVEYGKGVMQTTTIEDMLSNRDKTIHYAPRPPQADLPGDSSTDIMKTIIDAYSISPGRRVTHSKFGDGTVSGCDGHYILIHFDTEKGVKVFDLKMAMDKGILHFTS